MAPVSVQHRAVEGGDHDRQLGRQRRQQGQMDVQQIGAVGAVLQPAGELGPRQRMMERLQRDSGGSGGPASLPRCSRANARRHGHGQGR